MRRTALLAAGMLSLLAISADAQELSLEKILNPVADYDPFEAPAAGASG